MSLNGYNEDELFDFRKAKMCMEDSIRKNGLIDEQPDFQLKTEWMVKYAEALGSIDWLIVDEGKYLDYIPTITFLFWLTDMGYISIPEYKNPDRRARMYIWEWGGHIGEVEKLLSSALESFERNAKYIRSELDKLVI